MFDRISGFINKKLLLSRMVRPSKIVQLEAGTQSVIKSDPAWDAYIARKQEEEKAIKEIVEDGKKARAWIEEHTEKWFIKYEAEEDFDIDCLFSVYHLNTYQDDERPSYVREPDIYQYWENRVKEALKKRNLLKDPLRFC